MAFEEDVIAGAVLDKFDSLTGKYKPVAASQDFFQWVPLTGIVAVKSGGQKPQCISLGTGMKCLPINQVAQAHGLVVHDWHAEIVALRAFNHYLLHECLELATSPTKISPIIRRRDVDEVSEHDGLQPFTLLDDLQLHMYASEAPCGDASMELLMEAQADPTPWPIEKPHSGTEKLTGLLRGRESFGELGIVRRKPARADSPQTLSKSCSDKLALRQCTSLLSSCTSLLVSPANAYLESFTLPKSQHVPRACSRSFGPDGRMQAVANQEWSGGYSFRPFKIRTTDHEFKYSRRSMPATSKELRTSNIAAVFNPHLQEALILGRLQGRKKLDPKAASAICSKRMWQLALQVFAALGTTRILHQLSETSSVRKWKESALFADRRRVKADVTVKALAGWIPNDGDDFEVELG
ncbi:MAG: hypothetical protein Q9220_006027 [cf. Caloplaca sp. 1 TL-2023]